MKLIVIISPVVMIIVVASVFYFGGIKQHGTPTEFREKQIQKMEAVRDSLRYLERMTVMPENKADSTLYGVGRHDMVFESTRQYESQLRSIQSSLDSLEREKLQLSNREENVSAKLARLQAEMETSRDIKIANLASIYDNMKAPQAVPLIIAMEDTLAVKILSLMNQRNASRILGSLAEADINKAARLNRLLSQTSVGTTQ